MKRENTNAQAAGQTLLTDGADTPEVRELKSLVGEKEQPEYDLAAKNVLSNKVIVANILSETVPEFGSFSADEVRLLLKSGVNDAKVACLPTDDAHSDMATVSFDVNMRIKDDDIPLDIEIDIEPQGKLYPTYNGQKYSVYRRAAVYGCRMVDRQLKKYDNDYDKVHKCYSIWICFQKDGNSHVSMTRHKINPVPEDVILNPDLTESERNRAMEYLKRADRDMDLLEVIMIYIPKSYDKTNTRIQRLLYSVFNKYREGIKPFISDDEWKIIESEVVHMGHLEAELKDMYLEEGKEEGIKEGENKTKVITVNKLVNENVFSFEKALQFMGITKEIYDRVIESGVIVDNTAGAAPVL